MHVPDNDLCVRSAFASIQVGTWANRSFRWLESLEFRPAQFVSVRVVEVRNSSNRFVQIRSLREQYLKSNAFTASSVPHSLFSLPFGLVGFCFNLADSCDHLHHDPDLHGYLRSPRLPDRF